MNIFDKRLNRESFRGLPSPAMVVAIVALFVALGGTGYAATTLVSSGATAAKATSTRGKTGPRGHTGKTGPVGPTGPAGPRGAHGSIGATGPTGPKGSPGVVGEITVVTTISVSNGSFASAVADCPAGFEAIGGGVDLNNVSTMIVTQSTPRIADTRPILIAAGQHGAATGWQGAAVNNGAAAAPMAVTAICAPTS